MTHMFYVFKCFSVNRSAINQTVGPDSMTCWKLFETACKLVYFYNNQSFEHNMYKYCKNHINYMIFTLFYYGVGRRAQRAGIVTLACRAHRLDVKLAAESKNQVYFSKKAL